MNLKHLSLAKRQDYENITVVPILSDTDTPFDVLDKRRAENGTCKDWRMW